MKLFRWQKILALAAVWAAATSLRAAPAPLAQPKPPHIAYVYPAGAKQGTAVEITIGGQNLLGVNAVHFSGSGIQAQIVEVFKPVTVVEIQNMRVKLEALFRKKGGTVRDFFGSEVAMAAATRFSAFTLTGQRNAPSPTNDWTAEDQKTLESMRKRLASFVPAAQLIPALDETVTLKITVAPDAEPGDREVRVGGRAGLSNPMRFCVGQLPEFTSPMPKLEWDRQNKEPQMRPAFAKRDMNITLPATVNGQIMSGGVDAYHFHATQGQRLVINTHARDLIPYLADAVPGWFQATLTLYDAKGKELAYDADFRFRPDPALYYQIAEEGNYTVEIRDSVYRGRQDFVYRVSLGELPFITSIFPLGGPVGKPTLVEVRGWNLPASNLMITPKEPGLSLLAVRNDGFLSNHVPFGANDLPECLEQEPNDLPGSAQHVKLPVLINGRIDHSGDQDVFTFEGHAGEQIVAEVYARRLDSSLDSSLRLTDANGKQLAFNDDNEDKASGLDTHHADSYLTATLPADGAYYLQLSDTQRQGGPDFGYRLRLSAPRPDFALRVVPPSLSVAPGSSTPITVYALRQDGFANEITIQLHNAPGRFKLSGSTIPGSTYEAHFTLTAPYYAPPKGLLQISFEGRAVIDGKPVVRAAVPASDMMQAFAYRHLVPAQDLEVAIVAAPPARAKGAYAGFKGKKKAPPSPPSSK